MSRIDLNLQDLATRLVLKAILEAEGHTITATAPNLAIHDNVNDAIAGAKTVPALVLASAQQIADAVAAMRQGVFGYIFLPLQAGETEAQIRRALEWARGTPSKGEEAGPDLRPLAEIERDHIQRVLRHAKNNHTAAAKILGIGRNTLWRKTRQLPD